MNRLSGYILIFALLLFSHQNFARSFRVAQIPNGSVKSCANCHVSPSGGGDRNAFGKLVEARFLNNDNVTWGPELASLDADGDGVSNGDELLDRYGLWITGQQNPGLPVLVKNPGVVTETPLTNLTVKFSNMATHAGQKLFIRVVDISNMTETGRTVVNSVSDVFDVVFPAVISGNSYYVDFFVDVNNNGLYDSPPTDHTYRIQLNNALGNDMLNFAHNTSFTDIVWKYNLTFNLSGMSPHLDQLFEARLIDNTTNKEILRKRVEAINSGNFSMTFPVLENNSQYRLEFYADVNKNGVYNSPPVDHAWQEIYTNNAGDFTLQFTHNTSFSDIPWKPLLTLNLLSMSPHLGQQFELRVVKKTDNTELDRIKLNSINTLSFSVQIPQIESSTEYNIDFYVDVNGNKLYDAPPTDHAWRLSFSTAGNYITNFTHNTSFTDILWEPLTNIDEDIINAPNTFALYQNYPNPFNPTTTIKFNLANSGFVKVAVYNVLGQEIKNLISGNYDSGLHNIVFDASGLKSGIYIYKIEGSNFSESKKMILLK
ncbi:MAG: T9SS type A sorting domain-containing protein [bacterium]